MFERYFLSPVRLVTRQATPSIAVIHQRRAALGVIL